MKPVLDFRPIDDGARAGTSVLLRAGNRMALGRWNGAAWVYPATSGREVEFKPVSYYDPATRSAGAFHG